MRNYGGPVFNKYQPQIHIIWWGSEWNSTSVASWYEGVSVNASALKTQLISDFATIVNSDHYLGLWQYGGIKKPIIGGNVTHTTTVLPPGNVTSENIATVVRAAMNAGQVPNAATNGESSTLGQIDLKHIYFVMIPPNKELSIEGWGFSSSSMTSDVTFAWSSASVLPYQYWISIGINDPALTGTANSKSLCPRVNTFVNFSRSRMYPECSRLFGSQPRR